MPLTDIAVLKSQLAISGPGAYLFTRDENARDHQNRLVSDVAAGEVFKKYSQMKVQMKRVGLAKLNRPAN